MTSNTGAVVTHRHTKNSDVVPFAIHIYNITLIIKLEKRDLPLTGKVSWELELADPCLHRKAPHRNNNTAFPAFLLTIVESHSFIFAPPMFIFYLTFENDFTITSPFVRCARPRIKAYNNLLNGGYYRQIG